MIKNLYETFKTPFPPASDRCAWILLERAQRELLEAPKEIRLTKFISLCMLVRYGWQDVFKESLIDGKFKSEEEAGRFHCSSEDDESSLPMTNFTDEDAF